MSGIDYKTSAEFSRDTPEQIERAKRHGYRPPVRCGRPQRHSEPFIQAQRHSMWVIGPALTVEVRPGDNLMPSGRLIGGHSEPPGGMRIDSLNPNCPSSRTLP